MVEVEHSENKRPSWKSHGSGVAYVRIQSSYSRDIGDVCIKSNEYDDETKRSRRTYVNIPFEKLVEFVEKVKRDNEIKSEVASFGVEVITTIPRAL
jgi:hypothetical protein